MHNLRDLETLTSKLAGYGVPDHPDIARATDAWHTLQRAASSPDEHPGRLLDLDPAELRARLTESAVFHDRPAVTTAAHGMQLQLTREAFDALASHVPTILEHLRPVFNKAAAEVLNATKTGLRPGMTAEDVLELDPSAVAAWRTIDTHAATLQRIADIRIELSTMLGLPPQVPAGAYALGARTDYTVCFVDPAAGVATGYATNARAVDRWLALSLASGGRLRLTDPDEITDNRTDVPGWIVSAAAVMVYDDQRHAMHLYAGDWLPTWVDSDQREHLTELGYLIPAPAGATHPGDRYPDTVDTGQRTAKPFRVR